MSHFLHFLLILIGETDRIGCKSETDKKKMKIKKGNEMKKNSVEFKQRVFDLMNGSLDLERYPVPESGIVKNEFEEGEACDLLYREVYDANRRICERLGVEEDSDVEIIIRNLLEIGEHQAMRMYDYGRAFSECP